MKIEKIEYDDKKYPKLLRKIPSPPMHLYAIGNIDLLNKNGIAIVGSRKCSQTGAKLAKEFARDLSSAGVCIISGMAKGIDSASHIGAMVESGKTIAVLGCGLNHIYPVENTKLFNQIIENGGAIISEYEPDEEPESVKFVQRNRIVSGMSLGVLVVEAAIKSGTGITAEFAKKQEKKIFCIPHNVDEKLGKGTNRLLQRGAKCVLSAQDILDEFEELKDYKIKKFNKNNINVSSIPEEYREIYLCLKSDPCNIENICRKTNESIVEVNSKITLMELDGLIERLPGNFIKLV